MQKNWKTSGYNNNENQKSTQEIVSRNKDKTSRSG